MVREVISVHIGQCGVQVGGQYWSQVAQEHGLQPDHAAGEWDDGLRTFFSEANARAVPRAVLADLDPNAVDEVRAGPCRGLFRDQSVVVSNQGGGSNFGRGRDGPGREVAERVLDCVRRLADDCDNPCCFMVYHSVGGGTGSGVGSRLLRCLATEFPRKRHMAVSVFPRVAPTTGTVVEAYNAVLALGDSLIDFADLDFVFDNEGIHDLCRRGLGLGDPSLTDLNKLLARAVSCTTAPMRFPGEIDHLRLDVIEHNPPYPRIHFMLQAYAPVVPERAEAAEPPSILQLAMATLQPANLLAKCDPRAPEHYCLSMYVLLRGDDVVFRDANQAMAAARAAPTVQFVPWAPTGPKSAVSASRPGCPPRSASTIVNSTAVSTVFHSLCDPFDRLLSRRAFVHWFVGEGLEEHELGEARENLAALQVDYEEIATFQDDEG